MTLEQVQPVIPGAQFVYAPVIGSMTPHGTMLQQSEFIVHDWPYWAHVLMPPHTP
jgi:hypothetical protein